MDETDIIPGGKRMPCDRDHEELKQDGIGKVII